MLSPLDSGLVVIVEDSFIRAFMRTVLTRAGHRTAEVDVREGMNLLSSGEHIKALITNTPAAFRSIAASIPLVYTTSCPDPEATQGFQHCRVLQKPFHAGQLLDALKEVSVPVLP
ncbi:MAG: hypothetical protein P4L56_16175 [Candidatus Sulfopaludibacter sp.]|nr:hypothetical protein [Candidatus Sulfopaludibacter sp.]